jgi:uncharacterized protein YjbI with pentapeptide repeats
MLTLWITLAVVTALALLICLWWGVPKWQMESVRARNPKDRADIEDNFRKTIGQALGGFLVLIGAGMAYYGTQQTIQASETQSRFSQEASHALLISQQVAKGFEQLASDKLIMRLGGIYALEGVMRTSEQYGLPVLEALCAFVRDGTVGKVNDKPATDIQAALTVIGRRAGGGIDLAPANLAAANIRGAKLAHAGLRDANLENADLSRADLSDVNLIGAYLIGANLSHANLFHADLRYAHLKNTDLNHADLLEADLRGAYLSGANLSDATLGDADLREVNLSGANLRGVTLRDADLSEVNLSGANLDGQEQLTLACGTNAVLPQGMTLKPCPKKPEPELRNRRTTP